MINFHSFLSHFHTHQNRGERERKKKNRSSLESSLQQIQSDAGLLDPFLIYHQHKVASNICTICHKWHEPGSWFCDSGKDKMDDGGQHQNGRYKMEYYKAAHSPWNMMPQHQIKEQTNALVMNKKIMAILAERDSAIEERNFALAEKKEALAARDDAIQQREKALAERDKALMERDNALAAIQYRENAMNFPLGGGNQRGSKRIPHNVYTSNDMAEATNAGEMHITDAYPLTIATSEIGKSRQIKRSKENKTASLKANKSPRKVSKMGEDLNRQSSSDGKKIKVEWDSQDAGLNLVSFDESTMPVPVCSCTGVARQCYKWGNGGWQSSCCTTTLSSYPLPQMPNKRHARVGGRKMSGSVFAKLLSRLSSEGQDLSLPVDLKDFWARHGTNRYITIK